MTRDDLARYIENEGHRVEIGPPREGSDAVELLFRSRGYVFSVGVREGDPPGFDVATAYEIPPWARERAQNAIALQETAKDLGNVRFLLASNGKNFVVTLVLEKTPLQEFQRDLWVNVARVREGGVAALERILNRSESRAAANKFIKSLTRGS